jgi:hypothetical protein
MFNIQEREEWEYRMGCASELQNALTRSRLEFTDDSGSVRELTDAGRYVVVFESTAYCQSTDAIIGTRKTLVGDFATNEEAQALVDELNEGADEECSARVYCPKPPTVVVADTDIPF